MSRFLLTPSLHSDFRFYNLLETKVKTDFLDTLLKNKGPKTESMQKGIDFENDVFALCNGGIVNGKPEYKACVSEVADQVRGAVWQERVYIEMTLHGMPFLVYGKADCMLRNYVKDIKYTETYDIGKFIGSVQHDTYMLGSGIPFFRYLVTNGRSVWMEDYAAAPDIETKVRGEFAEMVDVIFSDEDFRKAYEENWGAKR